MALTRKCSSSSTREDQRDGDRRSERDAEQVGEVEQAQSFGYVCSQLRQFLDTTTAPWQAEELADKPATGFTATYEEHGGQEATLLSLYQTFHHWGSVILPTGYVNYDVAHAAGGNPYGVSQVGSRASRDPEYAKAVLEAARFQGARLARMAAAVAAVRANSRLG